MQGSVADTFEDLRTYQRARDLTNAVYALTREAAFARDFELTRQIGRAAISVMSNIAEGFERGASAEFVQFLFVAKGSCGEVRAQLQIAHDQSYISGADHARLHELACLTSRMISRLIASLQGSRYKGRKYTGQARSQTGIQRKRDAAPHPEQPASTKRAIRSGQPDKRAAQ